MMGKSLTHQKAESPENRLFLRQRAWMRPTASLLVFSLCFTVHPASAAGAGNVMKPPKWWKFILDHIGETKNAAVVAYQKLIGTSTQGGGVKLDMPVRGAYVDPDSREVTFEWRDNRSSLSKKLTLALYAASRGAGPDDNPGIKWKRYLYDIDFPAATETGDEDATRDAQSFSAKAKPRPGDGVDLTEIPVQALPLPMPPSNNWTTYAFEMKLKLPEPASGDQGRLWMWRVYETVGDVEESIPDEPALDSAWFHETSQGMKNYLKKFEKEWPSNYADISNHTNATAFLAALAEARTVLTTRANENGVPALANDEDCLAVAKFLAYRRLDFTQTGLLHLEKYIAQIADNESGAESRRAALNAVRQSRLLFLGQTPTIPLVLRPRRRALVAGITDYAHIGIYPQDLLGDAPDDAAQMTQLKMIAQKLDPQSESAKVKLVWESLRRSEQAEQSGSPGMARKWAITALDALRDGSEKRPASVVAEDIAAGLTEACEEKWPSVGSRKARQATVRDALEGVATPSQPDTTPVSREDQLPKARIGFLRLRNFLAASGINFDRGDELKMLWERDATATKIPEALDSLLRPPADSVEDQPEVKAADDTVLFVYLLGHGYVDPNNPLEPYLVGWDNQKIEVVKIAKHIAEQRGGLRHVVFLIDGCNTKRLAESEFESTLNKIFTFPDRRINWFVIASATGNTQEGKFAQALTTTLSDVTGVPVEPGMPVSSGNATVSVPFIQFAEMVRFKTLDLTNQNQESKPSENSVNGEAPFLSKVFQTTASVLPPDARQVALRSGASLGRILHASPPSIADPIEATAATRTQAEFLLGKAEYSRIKGDFSEAMLSLNSAWNMLSSFAGNDSVQAMLDPLRMRIADAQGRLNLEIGEFEAARFWFYRQEIPAKRLGESWLSLANARRSEAIAYASLTGDSQGVVSPPIPEGRNALEADHGTAFSRTKSPKSSMVNNQTLTTPPAFAIPRVGVSEATTVAARDAVAAYEVFLKSIPRKLTDAKRPPEWAARARLGCARMQRLLGNSSLAQDVLNKDKPDPNESTDAEQDALSVDIPILTNPLQAEIRLLKADLKLDLARIGTTTISQSSAKDVDKVAESALYSVQKGGDYYYPALHQAAHLTEARAHAAAGSSRALDEYKTSMEHADLFADQLRLPSTTNQGSISGNMRTVYLEYIALRWKAGDRDNTQREQDTLAAALRMQRSWGDDGEARRRTSAELVKRTDSDKVIRALLRTSTQTALVYVAADDRTHIWVCRPNSTVSSGVQATYSAVPYGLAYLRDRVSSQDTSALQTVSLLLVPPRIQTALCTLPATQTRSINVYWDSALPPLDLNVLLRANSGKISSALQSTSFQMIPVSLPKKE